MPFNAPLGVPSIIANANNTAADIRTALEVINLLPPLPRDGSTYIPPLYTGGVSTVSVTASILYTALCATSEVVNLERYGISVTTLSAGNVRLGVYRAEFDSGLKKFAPTDLLHASAEISTGSTGDKESTGITLELRPGYFFLVACFSATPTVRTLSFARSSALGIANYSGSSYTNIQTAFTYGALPDPYPTPTFDSSSSAPSILWRPTAAS